MLSATETAHRLGITLPTLRRVAATGLLTVERIGRTSAYDEAEVDALAAWPPVQPDRGAAIVVRLTEPAKAQREERMIGWNQAWDETTKREAARQWWTVADPQAQVGKALVAVVARRAVGAWLITGYEQDRGGSVAFRLADVTPEAVERDYLHRVLVDLKSGPPFSYEEGPLYDH